MNHEQLRAFVTVVEEQSFSRAAKKLYVSQPAISQKIALLEKSLDTVLLQRGKSKVQPTEEGLVLYREARRLEDQFDRLQYIVRNAKSSRGGHLRLACSDTVGAFFLPPVLQNFMALEPEVLLTAQVSVSGQISQSVLDENIDFGFILLPENDPRLVIEKVLGYRDVLTYGPQSPLTRQKQIGLSDLLPQRLLLPGRQTRTRKLIEAAFHSKQLQLPEVQEVGNVAVLKEFVRIGLGVGICPDYAVNKDPDLHTAPLDGLFDRTIAVCYRKDRFLSAADQSFLQVLRQSANFNKALA